MEINIMKENEVECPYCYAIYDINEVGLCFNCSSCESDLEVEFDEDSTPYVENY